MDARPIGIFDSGLGGLTVVPPLLQLLPQEQLIYFGDTARTPYGSKSQETIRTFACEIVDFLLSHRVKAVLIACNTVSAACLEDLQECFPELPFLGIIQPMVRAIQQDYRTGRYAGKQDVWGVIGTKMTITSGTYRDLFQACLPDLPFFSQACPLFVPLIEEGLWRHPMMTEAIHYYLDDFLAEHRINHLILGCTHYHFLEKQLKELYPGVEIVNPARAQVTALKNLLEKQDLINQGSLPAPHIFYASDLSDNFLAMIHEITGDQPASIKFKQFNG